MRQAVQYHVYSRPLARPLFYGRRKIESRAGILIRAGDSYGEAAPLESHSSDSLSENLSFLLALGAEGVLESIQSPSHETPPALAFALESLGAEPNVQWGSMLHSNALVPWSGYDATLNEIFQRSAEGYSTVKLKVFPENLPAIPSLISLGRERGLKVNYRLDGNRSLHPKEVHRLAKESHRLRVFDFIEYIEEPYLSMESIFDADIPIAADESAQGREQVFRLADRGIGVFILKPTILGGVAATLRIADELERRGLKSTITSALETAVGRRHIVHGLLASGFSGTTGISTGHLFSLDFLPNRAAYAGRQYSTPEEIAWLRSLPWESLP